MNKLDLIITIFAINIIIVSIFGMILCGDVLYGFTLIISGMALLAISGNARNKTR